MKKKATEDIIESMRMCDNEKIIAYADKGLVYVFICTHHRASEGGFACINNSHEQIRYKAYSKQSIIQAMKHETVFILDDISELLSLKQPTSPTDEEIIKMDFYDLCGVTSIGMSDKSKIKYYRELQSS